VESEVGGTWVPWTVIALSITGKAINTGRDAVSTRAEAKLDIPLSTANRGLKSLFYIAIENGQDHYKDISLVGTETVAGYRYHSNGFIGDVNFRIVGKNPWKKTLGDKP
jgi:hypothetical protein